jgi:hypothetical protein
MAQSLSALFEGADIIASPLYAVLSSMGFCFASSLNKNVLEHPKPERYMKKTIKCGDSISAIATKRV